MKTVAIIQARMGSTRLPGKMMMNLGGKPAVSHVFDRAAYAKLLDEVWLATSNKDRDDVLASWAQECRIPCYRGSEDDVLDRYYQAARTAEADVVVRLTADCPLIDPELIDRTVRAHIESKADYTSNVQPPTYPDGLDIEVISMQTLERAWKEAKLSSEREHVTPYIWKHPELFTFHNVSHDADMSDHRWTLDTPEDLEFLRKLVAACDERGEFCGLEECLKIVQAHPQWQTINARYQRNEGYAKSVAEDEEPR